MKYIQVGAGRAITKRTVIYGGLLLAGAGFFSTPVFATCSFTGGAAPRANTVNLGTRRIPATMVVGATIATIKVPGTGQHVVSCRSGPFVESLLLNYAKGAGLGNRVYPTNIPGVGIRVAGPFYSYAKPRNNQTRNGPVNLYDIGPITITLIKTGPITAGAFATGVMAQLFYTGISGAAYTLRVTGGSIRTYGCSITNTNINIPLGTYKAGDFSSAGFSTAWKDFVVPLQCDPSTRVFFRVDATRDASNVDGVMKLDSGGTVASGLGVQLYYTGTTNPVVFGQSSEYKTSTGGEDAVKLSARYYQTAANVTPGDANATATFTLTYQ